MNTRESMMAYKVKAELIKEINGDATRARRTAMHAACTAARLLSQTAEEMSVEEMSEAAQSLSTALNELGVYRGAIDSLTAVNHFVGNLVEELCQEDE